MDQLQILFTAVQHLRATSYTCAAAITILLYDMMLTMPAEVALIWPARFSLVKLLYFLVSKPFIHLFICTVICSIPT